MRGVRLPGIDGRNLWRERGFKDAQDRKHSRVEQVRADYGPNAARVYAEGFKLGRRELERAT